MAKFKIYQTEDERFIFENLKKIEETQKRIDESAYNLVYESPKNVSHITINDLEDIYTAFNIDCPPEYCGRAMTVSDIVEIIESDDEDKIKPGIYFCDSFGFKTLKDFDVSKCKNSLGEDTFKRVVILLPGVPAYATRMKTDLQSLQHAVDGYIEASYPIKNDNVYVIGNDEAKIIGMKGNRRIGPALYAGPIIILGDDGQGETRDLTDDEVAKYLEEFKIPQDISEKEVLEDLNFGFKVYPWR